MNADSSTVKSKVWTASQLRQLPETERDAILESAATLAKTIYRTDPDLTDFEAFGEDDSGSVAVRCAGSMPAATIWTKELVSDQGAGRTDA